MPHVINVSRNSGCAECGYLYFAYDLAIHLRYEPANPEAYPADWETVCTEYEDPNMFDIIERTYKSKY